MQAARYKLGLLAGKKCFTHMPEQLDDETYGTISGAFGKDAQEACYVVRFVGRSQVEILGYVNMSGEVYRTCAPVKDAALPDVPDLVIRKSSGAESGLISVLDEHGRLRRISHFKGAAEGTMRESANEPTWNSKRSLRYGDFMASLYLRYCVFGAAGTGATSSGSSNAEHERFVIEMHALDEPVELFCGFASASLPDAIDALLYRIESNQNPCGLELYAKRLMSEVDLSCLRTCSVKTTLTLARIGRTRSFFVNFDRSGLLRHEVETVLSVETVLNRLSRMLDRMGAGTAPTSMSPSEEDCSRIDRRIFDETTGQVAQLLEQLSEPNPWAMPGTIHCAPGGEWDVRTRFAHLAEGINITTRLDYRFDVDVSRGAMRVQLMQPPCAAMPRSFYDELAGEWAKYDEGEIRELRAELLSRVVLTLAAACFAAGLNIERCLVQVDPLFEDERPEERLPVCIYEFTRSAYMAKWREVAKRLDTGSFEDAPCLKALEDSIYAGEEAWPAVDRRKVAPANDMRMLPESLRSLLLADTAAELEVMEDSEDPRIKRVVELRELVHSDPAAAAKGFAKLVDELEAACAMEELAATGPVESQFCENYLARLLLPLTEDDGDIRVLRVPDALYFAQYELCNLYTQAGDLEALLPQARKLYDMAKSSMQAHFSLINVLAQLERFDEVVEVGKHAARLAHDRASIGYLFYRIAFAYWNLGDRQMALACYRLIPRGEEIEPTAQEEMRALMAEMDVSEPPSFEDAVAIIERAGIALPPTEEVSNFIANLAVQLVDNGFFFLGARCVYQMWCAHGSDELNVLSKSLQ